MFRAATAGRLAAFRGPIAGARQASTASAPGGVGLSAGGRLAGFGFGALAVGAAVFFATSTGTLLLDQSSSYSALEAGKSLDPRKLGSDVKWVVVDGAVYDVSKFIDEHPGGVDQIQSQLGKDVTALFQLLHPKGTLKKVAPSLTVLGSVHPSVTIEEASTGEAEAAERRLRAPPLDSINTLAAFAPLAHDVLGNSETWNYYSGWADSGTALETNTSSYSFIRFLPRIGMSISPTSTATTFLSSPVSLPVFISPTAQNRGGHPLGEINHTRAAAACQIVQGLSNVASISIPEIGSEKRRLLQDEGISAPLWWQLYLKTNREVSANDLREAVKAGATAIFFTMDTPVLGKRVNGHVTKAGVTVSQLQLSTEPNLKWSDIAWIKSIVPGIPVIVKGVGCAADVQLAKQHGADGVVISNHGGRQLDHTSPPLATLVRTRRAYPELLRDPTFEVYIDGGITRGTEVLKALCLGARGVGVGRPIIYAQTVYGEEGIIKAVAILREEIEIGMKLLGAQKLEDLKPEMLDIMDGLLGSSA